MSHLNTVMIPPVVATIPPDQAKNFLVEIM